MNFDNDEDGLELINHLLERLHQAGFDKNGSRNINLVYVASGGQHVETLINIGASHSPGLSPTPSPLQRHTQANDDTPLSALFRKNHHEELRKVIESWRPYLIDDDPGTDALGISNFVFDKDRIYSNKVYRDLCELHALGALQVPMSQLARYLTAHSNVSRSYTTLYQQLKYYSSEHE